MKRIFSAVMICLLGLSVFTILPPKASASNSLVGYWKFDEGSGSVAYDSSGNENDGTIYGAAWITGRFGNALSFRNDYVFVPDSSSLQFTNAITVSAWVRVTGATGTFKVICAKWYTPSGGSAQSFVLEFVDPSRDYPSTVEDERQPWFRVINSAHHLNTGDDSRAISDTPVAYGKWAHITGTYDGASVKIYVNGLLKGNAPLSGPIYVGASKPLTIGAHPWSGDRNWFNGIIDEVKIYNRALTSDEIYNDYGVTEPSEEPTPLWMQWWFWAIIALVFIVGVLAFATFYYRRKPSTSKRTSPMQNKPTSNEYKVCPNCGANLPADSEFCGKCGTSLE